PTEYPNLVTTTDFKHFSTITRLEPEKTYNWITNELLNWETFDGQPAIGILYKPENFDPQNKYPIIFYFYEKLSNGLNQYLKPELSCGPINIPYFVSQGYLVFCPDIRFKIGKPGESIAN